MSIFKRKLIVIDMQNDFIDGPLGSPAAQAIVPKVKRRIADYLLHGDDVYFTRDTHFDNYRSTYEGRRLPIKHCLEFSKGWEVNSELTSLFNGKIKYIDKSTFGYEFWHCAFAHDPDFYINHGDDITIEIVGVCTDICVVTNALILHTLYPEAEIVVNAACCAGTTPEAHKAALQVLKSCQIEVVNFEED